MSFDGYLPRVCVFFLSLFIPYVIFLHVDIHSFDDMGSVISSLWLPISTENFIATNLKSSQLLHRHTLSTCYDAIFDISLSSTMNTILVSDDGRLRSFRIDLENSKQLIETTISSTKVLIDEQVLDLGWSTALNQFLVLTSKRLTTYDDENNLITLDLNLEKSNEESMGLLKNVMFI